MSFPFAGDFRELPEVSASQDVNLSKFEILGRKPVFLFLVDAAGSPVTNDNREIYEGRRTIQKVSIDLIVRANFLAASFRPKRASTVWAIPPELCDFLSVSGWGELDSVCDVEQLRLEIWKPKGVNVRVFSYPQTYAVP